MTPAVFPRVETDPVAAAALAAHELESTAVHGIVDAALLIRPAPVHPLPVTEQMLATRADSTLQAGHNWTRSNSTGSLNYTGDFVFGTQCIEAITNGGGSGTQSQLNLPRQTAIDMTGKAFKIWIKIDPASVANLASVGFLFGSGATAFANFVNGHLWDAPAAVFEQINAGEWVALTVQPHLNNSAGTGTLDWSAIRDLRVTVFDKAGGAGATARVLFGGLTIVPNDPAYPNGVISIGFDDGFASQFTIARPILDGYGYRASVYIIADRIDTGFAGGPWLTAAQLAALQDQNGWEICAHCFSSTTHTNPGYPGLASDAARDADMAAVRAWLRARGLRGDYALATPFGGTDIPTLAAIRRHFSIHRGVGAHSFYETVPPADPTRLRCYLPLPATAVAPNTTPGTLQWIVDMTKLYGGWTIFAFHDVLVTPTPGVSTETSAAQLQGLVDYIATQGVPVRTIGEVLGVGR